MAVLNSSVHVNFVLKFLIKWLKGNHSKEFVSCTLEKILIQEVIIFRFGWAGKDMGYMCMGCLCKGRSIKLESIDKRQVKGFSKNFCSISCHNGKLSLLFQLLGNCCHAKSLMWCVRPFGSSMQSGWWVLAGHLAATKEQFYSWPEQCLNFYCQFLPLLTSARLCCGLQQKQGFTSGLQMWKVNALTHCSIYLPGLDTYFNIL